MSLLTVRGLDIFVDRPIQQGIVENLTFTVNYQKTALLGGSGSGKTLTSRALMNLLPVNVSSNAQALTFNGLDLLNLSPQQWTNLRGREMAMVLQEPKLAFDPLMTIGQHMLESYQLYFGEPRVSAKLKALALLNECAFFETERIYAAYPHQLSGGQAQRAMIALMMIGQPKLLIADEPTSGLDSLSKREILKLFDKLHQNHGMAILIITHDLNLVDQFCDQAIILSQGKLVEQIAVDQLPHSTHAYTKALYARRLTIK